MDACKRSPLQGRRRERQRDHLPYVRRNRPIRQGNATEPFMLPLALKPPGFIAPIDW